MKINAIMNQIASDAVIDEAFKWYCQRRKDYHYNDLLLKLLHGYLKHLEDDGGVLRSVNRGISLGCPLSPLMTTLYLKTLFWMDFAKIVRES